MGLREIGALAVESFRAREALRQGKAKRAAVRHDNPCEVAGVYRCACWVFGNNEESWCLACRTTQSYYLAMRRAALASSAASRRLTLVCRKHVQSEFTNDQPAGNSLLHVEAK